MSGSPNGETLRGEAGNDTLDGRAGDDNLFGGVGNDTYVFGRGYRKDSIHEDDTTPGNIDTIRFTDVAPTDISITRDRRSLLLTINGTFGADQLTLFDWFSDKGKIERAEFQNGTVWGIAELTPSPIFPSPGPDFLVGAPDDDDVIDGLGGNDQIFGDTGNDILLGGEGDDSLDGESGNDVLRGGDGIDTLTGGDGNDTLDGGAGDDAMRGGAGNDTYIIHVGDGNDIVNESDSTPGNIDTLEIEALRGELIVNSDSTNLFLTVIATGDRIQLASHFNGSGEARIERIKFRDGTTVDTNSLSIDPTSIDGTEADNFILGTGGNDVINGLGGNDILFGGNGNDILNGGTGRDQLAGGQGVDTLNGGPGNDTLQGTLDSDIYNFAIGGGHDEIQDGKFLGELPKTDTLRFGPGIAPEDIFVTRDGTQGEHLTLHVNAADSVRLVTSNFLPSGAPYFAVDQVLFNGGVNWNQATLSAEALNDAATDGDDVIVDFVGTRSTIHGFGGNDQLSGLSDNDQLFGDDGDDTLLGGDGNDTLDGGAGNDILNGNSGNDVMRGGAGDDLFVSDSFTDTLLEVEDEGFDTLQTSVTRFVSANVERVILTGTAPIDASASFNDNEFIGNSANNTFTDTSGGSETYHFGRGAGTDRVVDFEQNVGEVDAVKVGPDALPEQLMVTRAGADIVLAIQGTSDTLTLVDWFGSPSAVIEEIRFDNGVIWDRTVLANKVNGAPNSPPEVTTNIDDQAAIEEAIFSFSLPAETFVDTDIGDTLTFSATRPNGSALPSWVTFVPSTRTFIGTPQNSDVGILGVKVTATDTGGLTAFDSFDVTVANVNDAPSVAVGIVNQSATEDLRFSFTVPANTFSDPDVGDMLSYSARRTDDSALPAWLTFDRTTRTLSGTPTNDDVGTINLKVIATDITGTAAASAFNVITANTNDAPTLTNAIFDQNATEDVVFSFQVPVSVFADVDVGDSLSLAATRIDGSALPGWLVFDAGTRSFSGTPGNSDVGILPLKVTAKDSGDLLASDTFDLAIANVNDPPNIANAIADQVATEDIAFYFQVLAASFSDVDVGDTLDFGASRSDGSSLPAWLTFDSTTRTFAGTPVNSDVGIIQLKVTAKDSGNLVVSDTFDLAIANSNDAPILANAIADQVTNEDMMFSFQVPEDAFSDVDSGDTLSLTATRADDSALPDWLSFDSATRTLTGTPTNGDSGIHSIRITAHDRGGSSTSDVFDLSVNAAGNHAPTLEHAIVDQTIDEDAPFNFEVPTDTFSDVDFGTMLSYSVSLADGDELPMWLTFDGETRTFSGTPINADVGTISVKITATDNGNLSASGTFDLTVANTNDAPVAMSNVVAVIENATTGNLVPTLLANDTDADVGDTRSITAVNNTGTMGTVAFDAEAQSLTYAANGVTLEALRAGVMVNDTFTYTVTDEGGASSTATVTMTVTGVNDAPTLNHATPDQVTTVGMPFILALSVDAFADTDMGDTLSYEAQLTDGSLLPAWLAFDVTTLSFSGTPTSGDAGVHGVKVTATDSGNLSASDVFDLSVISAPSSLILVGTPNNDVINGESGDDTINGREAADWLLGNGGNDIFQYFGDAIWGNQFRALNDITGAVERLAGKRRSYDRFEGGEGFDTVLGTSEDDALFLDDRVSPVGGGSWPRLISIEHIAMGKGRDVVDLINPNSIYGDVWIEGEEGDDVLWASEGNDLVDGGGGNDRIVGGKGSDLMQGRAGNDALNDGFGNNLFDAGSGNDQLSGGSGNEIYVGGMGNDIVFTGQGVDVLAFNRGDGQDIVKGGTGVDNTISFGGGIRYEDLTLTKSGNNLVLNSGGGDRITLENWYKTLANRSVLNLQIVAEAMTDFAPVGSDLLRDQKIERFDFQKIVQAFDQARATTPGVDHWSVMNALLDTHLAGSDTEALGGDLAYRYGLDGTLAGISTSAVLGIVGDPQFGSSTQALRPPSSLTEGLVKLS